MNLRLAVVLFTSNYPFENEERTETNVGVRYGYLFRKLPGRLGLRSSKKYPDTPDNIELARGISMQSTRSMCSD